MKFQAPSPFPEIAILFGFLQRETTYRFTVYVILSDRERLIEQEREMFVLFEVDTAWFTPSRGKGTCKFALRLPATCLRGSPIFRRHPYYTGISPIGKNKSFPPVDPFAS